MSVRVETTGQLLELLRTCNRLPAQLDAQTVAIIKECRERLGRKTTLTKLAGLIESHARKAIGLSTKNLADIPLSQLSWLLRIERSSNPKEDAHIVFEPGVEGIEIRLSDFASAGHPILLDQINLGAGQKFPIYNTDAIIIDADKPELCPKADQPEVKVWLPTILEAFKRCGLVKSGQTIHWVGPQAKLKNVCTCFRSNKEPDSKIETPPRPVAQSSRVKLFGQGEEILIDEKPAENLTLPQYNVIMTLIQAGSDGLTKDRLISNSGHPDAVNILKRVRAKPGKWKFVVAMAKITNGRYRIK